MFKMVEIGFRRREVRELDLAGNIATWGGWSVIHS